MSKETIYTDAPDEIAEIIENGIDVPNRTFEKYEPYTIQLRRDSPLNHALKDFEKKSGMDINETVTRAFTVYLMNMGYEEKELKA